MTTESATKISSVKFLDLEKILLYADSFNVFKNSIVKNIFLYNKSLNELIQLDSSINQELENMISNSLNEQKNNLSAYDSLFNDCSFYKIIKDLNMFSHIEDAKIKENISINANLRSKEEQLLLSHLLNQKNEFVMFLEKYLNESAKLKCYYKLADFFLFYFKSNRMQLFNIIVSILLQITLLIIIGK
jgi:hypothetical protein